MGNVEKRKNTFIEGRFGIFFMWTGCERTADRHEKTVEKLWTASVIGSFGRILTRYVGLTAPFPYIRR